MYVLADRPLEILKPQNMSIEKTLWVWNGVELRILWLQNFDRVSRVICVF